MTKLQKEHIINLRSQGESYSNIADALGISKNTVKSFCQRLNAPSKKIKIAKISADGRVHCRHCGNEVPKNPGRKPKVFCSSECRTTWWAAHPEAINQKAIYNFFCEHCNKAFNAYGNKTRKFCAHACYVASRFKKEVPPEK